LQQKPPTLNDQVENNLTLFKNGLTSWATAFQVRGANKLKLSKNNVAHHGYAAKKIWVLEALKTTDWRSKIGDK